LTIVRSMLFKLDYLIKSFADVYRSQVVACKEISERLMELLAMDLDPALLVSVSRPLVGLSNEGTIFIIIGDNVY